MGTNGRWVVDDDPKETFPIWTRGNVGEVFPNVVSPLTWSAYGSRAELGWREAFRKFGGLDDDDYRGEMPAIIGVFGGYCYLNVSVHRVLAVRTPGLTPADMDRAIFGESEAPAYEAGDGDKDRRATLRILRTVAKTLFAKALPQLDDDKAFATRWVAKQPDPTTATEEDLLATTTSFRPVFQRLFGTHIHTTFSGTIPTGILNDLCTNKLGDPGLVVRLLGGIGDVESAEPASALWDLGRTVAASEKLTAAFDAGLDGLEERLIVDGAAGFLRDLERFQTLFGSRGPNEWEGSSPTWGTDSSLVLAAIDAMRRADPSHAPGAQSAALAADRLAATGHCRKGLKGGARAQFNLALRSAALFSQGRERSKTTIIRAVHGNRLAQLELARRGRERGGPEALADFWLLRFEELPDYLSAPSGFTAVIDERRALRDELSALEPPFVFVGTQPERSTWTRRDGLDQTKAVAGTELRGIAGCPGVARGRARVVLDPADPRGIGPGDVLIAPITDPAWTPLFVPAEAVVVDVGAQMSHAVIVSRELGIPAVVSVTGATRLIPEGALIEVDGTAGVVRILEI